MAPKAVPRRPASGGQLRADRTRALAIDETIRCILEEGFAAASARHIAERAGVTWGVVQYHFGDRDGLLMAVVDQAFDELIRTLECLPRQSEALAGRVRVEYFVNAAWEAFSSPNSMAALEILIGTRVVRDAATAKHLGDLLATFTTLGRHLGEGLAAPHAAAVGNLIWATLRGLVVAQLVTPQPIDSSQDRQALVDAVTAYIEQQ